MKKFNLTWLLLLVVCLAVSAAPRGYKAALAIAQRQAAIAGTQVDNNASRKVMKKLRAGAQEAAPYYVFENAGGRGFTIVAGDDLLPDVLGYSNRGSVDGAELPPAFVWYLESCEQTVAAAGSGDRAVLRSLAEARSIRKSEKPMLRVEPLLGDIMWNQGYPYNIMCPSYDGQHTSATGCVATAMAQIMAYYRYPDALLNDIPAYTTETYGMAVSGEKAGEAYDWDAVLPSYTGGESPQSKDAVAKLMSHCGKAVQMDYGPSSGAYSAQDGFARYFGYDADLIQTVRREGFSISEWNGIIENELVARRPVYYSGQSTGGGHAFVCDGADGNGLFHINWGWGGYQNGYFDLTVLNPQKGGTGSGNSSDGYNRRNYIIVGIAPDNGYEDPPVVESGQLALLESDDSKLTLGTATRPDADGMLSGICRYRIGNPTSRGFNGYMALAIAGGNGELLTVSNPVSFALDKCLDDGRFYYNDVYISFCYALPVGIYKLMPVYSTDKNTWMKCSDFGGEPFKVKVDETSVRQTTESGLSGEIQSTSLFAGANNNISMQLSNGQVDDYVGLLNIYAGVSPSKPAEKDRDVYVGVEGGKTKQCIFGITPKSAGTLYLWVDDEGGNPVVEALPLSVEEAGERNFTLVSVKTNAVGGETQKPLVYEQYNIEVPKTGDGRATVTYGIRNNGMSKTIGSFSCFAKGISSGQYIGHEEIRQFAPGATEYITVSITEADVQSRFVILALSALDGTTLNVDELGAFSVRVLDDSGNPTPYVLNFKPNCQLLYIGGDPSGIKTAEVDGFYVEPGKGEAKVKAGKKGTISFMTPSGIVAARLSLDDGETATVKLTPGIYIAGKKKIIIR